MNGQKVSAEILKSCVSLGRLLFRDGGEMGLDSSLLALFMLADSSLAFIHSLAKKSMKPMKKKKPSACE